MKPGTLIVVPAGFYNGNRAINPYWSRDFAKAPKAAAFIILGILKRYTNDGIDSTPNSAFTASTTARAAGIYLTDKGLLFITKDTDVIFKSRQ